MKAIPYRCTKDISGNEKHNIAEYLKQSHLTLELKSIQKVQVTN